MNSIAGQLTIGAPRSQARYDQLGRAQKLLPVCADCIEHAPATQQFSALGIGSQWSGIVWGVTKCYVCEATQRCAYVAPITNSAAAQGSGQ